ncbi:DNA circularization N-terminal domain-containing protein [Actinobacillus genomosp. 2]|uniref:DNA circularization protein n=1 Tax=Actinobacillus genomosp. 2 TaxID=230709 RepID=UPI0024434BFC|nr:DNA circularization N-terminal domain-containing protein [Actinobacillus genomosp. 2]WGE32597.1 DNA circularization N-terminal domain-containing protein [Actinobacillus genomosp. 2]
MSGWTMPIQQASFKGVEFDVIAVDDSFERSVIEHAYPFVNGADLEDMGLNTQTIRLQAVFFGSTYYTSYIRLLSILQQKGADVLVHPIRGRMPNMTLVSANLRTDSENINYVALDLTFKESTEMQPIFVFEDSLISKIDKLLLDTERLFDDGMTFWNSIAAFDIKSRLLGLWGALFASFEAVRSLFDLDKKKYSIASSTSQRTYLKDGSGALHQLKEMVDSGIQGRADLTTLSLKSQLLNITDAVDNTQAIVSKVAKDEGFNRSKTVKLLGSDVVELGIMLDLIATTKLTKVLTELVEDNEDDLVISDLELINQVVREHWLSIVNKLREQQKHTQKGVLSDKTKAIYETAEKLINNIRNVAHQFTALILAVINKKPPLTVKIVQESGTIHKVAHYFYGNYERADELLHLNPQIRQPNFIERGTLLNCYSE